MKGAGEMQVWIPIRLREQLDKVKDRSGVTYKKIVEVILEDFFADPEYLKKVLDLIVGNKNG